MNIIKMNLSKEIKNRLLSGTIWSLTGFALSKVFILMANVGSAHILGNIDFAKLSIIRSTIALFITIGTFGIGLTANKFIAEFRAKNESDKIASIVWISYLFSFVCGIILSVLILLLARPISEYSLNDIELIGEVRCGAILLFMTIITAAQTGILTGFEKFKIISVNTFISGLFEFCLVLLGAHLYGVTGAIIGYGISFVTLFLLNLYAINDCMIKNNINRSIKIVNLHDISFLWSFSLPAAMQSMLVTPVFWIIRTMLIENSGYNELAVYEAADQLKVVILFIPTTLSNMIVPILSNIQGKNDKMSFSQVFKLSLGVNIAIATIVALIFSVFSNQIMSVYGKEFVNAWPLVFLALSTIVNTATLAYNNLFVTSYRMWENFGLNIIWAGVLILASHLFLSAGFGATALGIAVLVSYIILLIASIFYAKLIRLEF